MEETCLRDVDETMTRGAKCCLASFTRLGRHEGEACIILYSLGMPYAPLHVCATLHTSSCRPCCRCISEALHAPSAENERSVRPPTTERHQHTRSRLRYFTRPLTAIEQNYNSIHLRPNPRPSPSNTSVHAPRSTAPQVTPPFMGFCLEGCEV